MCASPALIATEMSARFQFFMNAYTRSIEGDEEVAFREREAADAGLDPRLGVVGAAGEPAAPEHSSRPGCCIRAAPRR